MFALFLTLVSISSVCFGIAKPVQGPHANKLTKSELCLREDVDIMEPRRILAMPRHQVGVVACGTNYSGTC